MHLPWYALYSHNTLLILLAEMQYFAGVFRINLLHKTSTFSLIHTRLYSLSQVVLPPHPALLVQDLKEPWGWFSRFQSFHFILWCPFLPFSSSPSCTSLLLSRINQRLWALLFGAKKPFLLAVYINFCTWMALSCFFCKIIAYNSSYLLAYLRTPIWGLQGVKTKINIDKGFWPFQVG